MKRAFLFISLVVATLLISGNLFARSNNGQTYNKHGLSLTLPASYEIDEDAYDNGLHMLSIENKADDAVFIMLHGYNAEFKTLESLDAESLFTTILATMLEDLDDDETIESVEDPVPAKLGSISGKSMSFIASDEEERVYGELFISLRNGNVVIAIKAVEKQSRMSELNQMVATIKIK